MYIPIFIYVYVYMPFVPTRSQAMHHVTTLLSIMAPAILISSLCQRVNVPVCCLAFLCWFQ